MKEKKEIKEVIKKIEEIGKEIYELLKRKENPYLRIPLRTLSNVIYDKKEGRIYLGNKYSKRYFLNIAHARKFMQTLLIMSHAKKLLEEDATNSLRDVYYALKRTLPNSKENTFEDQRESDPIIVDVETMLDVTREQINIVAEAKGRAVGELTVIDRGDEIDLRKMGSGGWAIPSNCEKHRVQFKETSAEFVLVVEKLAVWNRLNEDKFWKKHKCILITGSGQPDRGTRRLVHRLRYELNLPVYVFTDYDPWGLYIYSVYKRGSINLAYLSNKLSTPDSKFIGLVYEDISKFNIPKNVTIKMKDVDYKRANELLNYEWFKSKEWQEEIKKMIKGGIKMEQEVFANKGLRYVSEVYLPTKLREKDFLS